LIMLFNIAISIPSHIFIATINAHEQFIFLRGINLIKVLLQPLLVWGILAWKASVLNLVLTQTVFGIIVIGLNYCYCKFKLQVSFPINYHNKPLMKELTGFSIFVFLHAIMDQVYWRLGQLVLGAVSGATAVANYAIAIQLTTFAIFLPATMSGVFLPKLSAITAKTQNLTEINVIFCKLSRLQFAFVMLLFIGFAFLGKTFIILWVGPNYTLCYQIALLIMAGYIIDVTQNAGIPILQALNKHAFRAYVYITMAVLNICLCIPLAKKYGEMGCAIATTICLILGSGVSINWYYYHIGLNLNLFFKNILQLIKPIVLACVLIAAGIHFAPLKHAWISFVWHGIGLTMIYVYCLWLFGFNTYEKNLFLNPLKKIHRKFLK
ncbi:MAG: polysaccharide biosynthesis C-terminal domain-containing protein, partial [Elusimicrobiaceae bacterium]|nr:polysaccharide biosynthesis C-terminal domain-containing protein [Elusimicrobiaceae bacterium]